MTDEAIQLQYGPDTVMAVMKKRDGKDLEYRYKDFSVAEKLGKFMEDVKWVVDYLLFYSYEINLGTCLDSNL